MQREESYLCDRGCSATLISSGIQPFKESLGISVLLLTRCSIPVPDLLEAAGKLRQII
jgi:hypothetical protein